MRMTYFVWFESHEQFFSYLATVSNPDPHGALDVAIGEMFCQTLMYICIYAITKMKENKSINIKWYLDDFKINKSNDSDIKSIHNSLDHPDYSLYDCGEDYSRTQNSRDNRDYLQHWFAIANLRSCDRLLGPLSARLGSVGAVEL
jgi:hypothetical protein